MGVYVENGTEPPPENANCFLREIIGYLIIL